MEIFLIFTGSFIVALSGALMPGPLLTVTIVHSVKKGFIAGPLIILGHMILELSLLVGIVLGIQRFLLMSNIIKVIFIIGGAILIAMGIDFIINYKKNFIHTEKTSFNKVSSNSILSGIFVSLANPYWIIWWITIGLGYVIKALKYKFLGIAVFFAGHILADLSWYSFVSFTVSKGRKFLKDKVYHTIILVCGFLLVLFGIWFLYEGIT